MEDDNAKPVIMRPTTRSTSRFLLVLLVIVALAAAALIPYGLQQERINTLHKQVANLNAELTTKNAQPAAKQPSTPPATVSNVYSSTKGVKVTVYAPASGAKVASPLAVVGQVPGNWSFEASFPVVLKDSKGAVIAQSTAQVLGDWMTDQLVPFSAKLTYTGTPTGSGTLVLQKDNPSGMPANDDTVSIPIKF